MYIILILLLVIPLSYGELIPSDGRQVVTDAIGRQVAVPDPVSRVVTLNADAARIIIALERGESIVGIDGSEKDCGVLQIVYPKIQSLPEIGTVYGGTLSLEKIAAQHPDLVCISGKYPDIADRIQTELNIPVVCVYPTVNTSKDFTDTIRLLGMVMGREERAESLAGYIDDMYQNLSSRIPSTSDSALPSMLIIGEPYTTNRMSLLSSFKLLPYVGARYAAPDPIPSINGNPVVPISMEDIITWDSDYYFISGTALFSPDDLMTDPQWNLLRGVKDGHVHKVSTGFMGYEPANFVIMPLSIAKILHPDAFQDMDIDQIADDAYERMYGVKGVYTVLKNQYGIN